MEIFTFFLSEIKIKAKRGHHNLFSSCISVSLCFFLILCLNMGDGEGNICHNCAIVNMSICPKELVDYLSSESIHRESWNIQSINGKSYFCEK